jgi:UDP-2-acetamido-3-amino-2,3-dideoxy-glucuronate N-acetyltransferase
LRIIVRLFPSPRKLLNPMPLAADIFIHSHALCESSEVGHGTRIWAFAHVMKGAVIGRDCTVGGHAFVESGCRIGDRVTVKNQAMIWSGVEIDDDVFVGPGVTFTNDRLPRSPRMLFPPIAERYGDRAQWLLPIRIERGASLGARCVIVAGVTVGAYAMVAAGAVVTRNVAAHGLAMGAPARRVGWSCRCGERLALLVTNTWRCPRCGDRFDMDAAGECINLVKSY